MPSANPGLTGLVWWLAVAGGLLTAPFLAFSNLPTVPASHLGPRAPPSLGDPDLLALLGTNTLILTIRCTPTLPSIAAQSPAI